MPSTASSSLRLELQATGEGLSVWGTKTNTNLDLLEDAIVAETAIVLDGSPVTLTATNYAADQARAFLLTFTGTDGTVTIPSVAKPYWVRNSASGTVTLDTGSNTVDIATGTNALIYTDGANIVTLIDTNTRTPGEISAEIDADVLVLNQDLQGQINALVSDLSDLQVGALTTAQNEALTAVLDILTDPAPTAGQMLSHDGTESVWVTQDSILNTRANRWRFR